MSNRTFFNCYYEIDGSEPGEYQFMASGWGNEKIEQKYARLAAKDVIGTVNINYIGIKPVRNHYGEVTGTHLTQVQSVNMNGSLPDMYQSKHARRSAKSIIKMLDFLRLNEPCKCPRHLAEMKLNSGGV